MNKRKLLVVDDEVCIRELFEKVFTIAGYTVRSAESAEEALDVLKKDDIHVIFLDLKLPDMNGIELCKKLRKEKPKDIIYAVSGYTSPLEEEYSLKAGFDGYLRKPVELKELLEAASTAFEKMDQYENPVI